MQAFGAKALNMPHRCAQPSSWAISASGEVEGEAAREKARYNSMVLITASPCCNPLKSLKYETFLDRTIQIARTADDLNAKGRSVALASA